MKTELYFKSKNVAIQTSVTFFCHFPCSFSCWKTVTAHYEQIGQVGKALFESRELNSLVRAVVLGLRDMTGVLVQSH